MSRLYMDFEEGQRLAILGSERAYMGYLITNAALGAISLTSGSIYGVEDALKGLGRFLPEEYSRLDHHDPDAANKLRYAIDSVFSGEKFHHKGKVMESFSLMLNTAIVFGSDPVALAAKMHGTCEIHGYFLGEHRAWLADVIEQGLDANIFRRNYWAPRDKNADLRMLMNLPVTDEEAEYVAHSMGWTEVVEQLRKSDKGAVVMSHSSTDGFPEMPPGWVPEESIPEPESDYETRNDVKREMFSNLPDSEQFALALAELNVSGGNSPIGPETLRGELFRHELTLLDLMRNDIARIEKKLKLDA